MDEIIVILLIVFGVIFATVIIITVFHYAYAEKFNYNSCKKYDEEDAGICDMIFPPLRFESV